MPRLTGAALGTLCALAAPAGLFGQTLDAGPVKLDFTGRVQIQFNTSSVDDVPWSTFESRRVRFGAELEYEEWMEGKLEADYALGDLRLADAYVNFGFDPAFQLQVGQFKKPFSLLELTSSTQYPTIERGVRIRGLEEAFEPEIDPDGDPFFPDFGGDLVLGEEQQLLDALGYVGRDLGAAVHGEVGRFGYGLGVFNGSGADERDDNDRESFAARVTLQPWTALPLVVGAGASYRELRLEGELDGVPVDGRELGGAAVELDAEWGDFRRHGIHGLAEVSTGENLVVEEPFIGAQGIVAYFQPLEGERLEGIEPVVRVSFGDPNTERGGDHGVLVTPGVNAYFFGRNRVMLNWDLFLPGGERFDAAHAIRAQAQVYF